MDPWNDLYANNDVILSVANVYYVDALEMNGADEYPGRPGKVNPAKTIRCVNFNGGFAHKVDQHGIWLVFLSAVGHYGNWGLTLKDSLQDWKGPKSVLGAGIYINNIIGATRNVLGKKRLLIPPEKWPIGPTYFQYKTGNVESRQLEMIRTTIAHEIGHSLTLDHHYYNDAATSLTPTDSAPTRWYHENSLPWDFEFLAIEEPEEECVMRKSFAEIRLSMELYLDDKIQELVSRRPEWGYLRMRTKYGSSCRTPIGPCKPHIIIDDSDIP
jgi:hypothetical protein